MHNRKMPKDVVLIVPCLEHWPADKHVAAIASGKSVDGKYQTPGWEFKHTGPGYTSAPGTNWRRG